ncbi:hypothetical protein [Mycoplasma todarodis]|uniref:hypothetical protein n=1 Tax=Mycoplasma todarodis TaxID=1937191 RepID=UPI003B500298
MNNSSNGVILYEGEVYISELACSKIINNDDRLEGFNRMFWTIKDYVEGLLNWKYISEKSSDPMKDYEELKTSLKRNTSENEDVDMFKFKCSFGNSDSGWEIELLATDSKVQNLIGHLESWIPNPYYD